MDVGGQPMDVGGQSMNPPRRGSQSSVVCANDWWGVDLSPCSAWHVDLARE